MSKHIVVNDGQFQFPVLVSSLRPQDSEQVVKAMNGDEYSAWCMDVPMDASRGPVGSQGCIDFCNELTEAGADVWQIG